MPRRLRAAVAAAPSDYVKDRNGCHTGAFSSYIYVCVYGDTAGKTDVTLFGDSHALQWLPALEAAGKRRGWRVTSLTKTACPSVAVSFEGPFRKAAGSCRPWRANAMAWLKAHPQDVVVLTNSGRYAMVDGHGQPLSSADREKRWQRGLAKTIKALPKRTRVVLISDTPYFIKDPPRCLRAPSARISDCETRRAVAILGRHEQTERQAAAVLGATFADLNLVVCPYDPCPLFAGDTMMWRDNHHLTETYARQLAPAVEAVVRSALRGKPSATLQAVPPSGLGDETVAVEVGAGFFDPDRIEVDAGVDLEVIFTNTSRTRQHISFTAAGTGQLPADGELAGPLRKGTSGEIIFRDLAPGEYTFSSDADPEQMTGTLIVREPAPVPPQPGDISAPEPSQPATPEPAVAAAPEPAVAVAPEPAASVAPEPAAST